MTNVKNIKSVAVEAFYYPTEDKNRVVNAVEEVLPAEKYKEEKISGYYNSGILKISYKTTRSKEIKAFLERIKNVKITQPSSRLDDKGNFYLRFDKQKALGGKLELTRHGDAVLAKVKITSYPFDIEKIKEIMKETF